MLQILKMYLDLKKFPLHLLARKLTVHSEKNHGICMDSLPLNMAVDYKNSTMKMTHNRKVCTIQWHLYLASPI